MICNCDTLVPLHMARHKQPIINRPGVHLAAAILVPQFMQATRSVATDGMVCPKTSTIPFSEARTAC